MGFDTTRWSLILQAKESGSDESVKALEELCALYWPPLFAYLRHKGYGQEDARDLTQEFFTRFLEKDALSNVKSDFGKFRTFLLVCINRFLSNERAKVHAIKRFPGSVRIPIDKAEADGIYQPDPAGQITAQKVFDRQWALTVMGSALEELSAEFEDGAQAERFETFKGYLVADDTTTPYAELGKQLGMSEGAVKVAVHRLRRRYRKYVQRQIAQTVSTEAEIKDEIRYFLSLFE